MAEIDLDSRLAIPPQVMSRLVEDETVLLDLASGTYFGLDGVGNFIWEAVSTGKTLRETIALITEEYEVDETQVRKDVVAFTEDLVERGLLAL